MNANALAAELAALQPGQPAVKGGKAKEADLSFSDVLAGMFVQACQGQAAAAPQVQGELAARLEYGAQQVSMQEQREPSGLFQTGEDAASAGTQAGAVQDKEKPAGSEAAAGQMPAKEGKQQTAQANGAQEKAAREKAGEPQEKTPVMTEGEEAVKPAVSAKGGTQVQAETPEAAGQVKDDSAAVSQELPQEDAPRKTGQRKAVEQTAVSPVQEPASRTAPANEPVIAGQVSPEQGEQAKGQQRETGDQSAAAQKVDGWEPAKEPVAVKQPVQAQPQFHGPEAQEKVREIARDISLNISRGNNSMKLSLKPEFLGEVTVKVQFDANSLSLDMKTDNVYAKQLIESNSAVLKEALGQHGLELGGFEVGVRGENAGHGNYPDGAGRGASGRETEPQEDREEEETRDPRVRGAVDILA